ncbi:glycoside hydrolase family protein [Salix suchowensis]|nr:glycoside hydrolase family protein [Salix suchowensis]
MDACVAKMQLCYKLEYLLALAHLALALTVTIPTVAPSGAPVISPSLISLSLEQDRWTDWSGTTSRNEFFFNTLDNLKQITGQPPHIRIGANSEDHTDFNSNVQFAQDIFPAASVTIPYPEATNITVGNSYYLTARLIRIRLHRWIRFAINVSAAAGISATSHTKFIGASFAGSSHNAGFSPQAIFSAGILDSAPGKLMSTEGLLQDLMAKATIRGNLSTFSPDIAATRQRGAPGVSNTAGAALWTLDYALFAPQIGISRVFFHEGVGFKYNLVRSCFRPIKSAPGSRISSQIQPATLIRSTLDGSSLPHPFRHMSNLNIMLPSLLQRPSGPLVQAKPLSSPSTTPLFQDTLFSRRKARASIAFLASSAARGVVHISLGFAETSTRASNITIKRLAIGHADDTSGLAWGGQSYETPNGRKSGTLITTTGSVQSGFDIHDTEAVLVERTRLTYLCEVITNLDTRLIVDRRELDDHVQGFALLTSRGRAEVIGQVGTDAK